MKTDDGAISYALAAIITSICVGGLTGCVQYGWLTLAAFLIVYVIIREVRA